MKCMNSNGESWLWVVEGQVVGIFSFIMQFRHGTLVVSKSNTHKNIKLQLQVGFLPFFLSLYCTCLLTNYKPRRIEGKTFIMERAMQSTKGDEFWGKPTY